MERPYWQINKIFPNKKPMVLAMGFLLFNPLVFSIDSIQV